MADTNNDIALLAASLNAWALDAEQHDNKLVPVAPSTLRGIAAHLAKLQTPEIDYEALIAAAFKKDRKWAQGTNGCIAFARGAEWMREQVLVMPADEQEVQLSIILPERLEPDTWHETVEQGVRHEARVDGWNACLDEVQKLNKKAPTP